MTRERESRRRSPGIIARLMGMEGLPSQQPAAHKQQKRSSESYQQRTESVGPMRTNTLYEECSHRKSLKEEQEFKDVFEVVETRDVYHSRYPVQRNGSSKLTEAKMAFFRQKVMDAKRFSTDENLQVSKEFNDTLEVLDSNKDLFLECLQERNSLFSKHLHDLQNPLSQSHSRHAVVRKTSESRKSGSNSIGFVEGESTLKSQTSSRQRHYDYYLRCPYERGTHNSLKSSRFLLEEKDGTSTVPTRIVVLKPNLGRTHSVSKSASSPHPSYTSPSDSRMKTGLSNMKGKEAELRRKKYNPDAGVTSRQKSKESREIDKNITGRMKNRFSPSPLNFPSSEFNGYMGDESSCYVSGNESETESEVTTLTYRKSFDWNGWHWISSSHSPSSSTVNNEARKKLSERQNTRHNFKEVGLAGRNSTLGEILAISNGAVMAKNPGSISDHDSFASIQESLERVLPLGISSKDGWRDACIESLSRSRSLSVSNAAFGSPKTRNCHGTLEEDRYPIVNDAINLGRNKAVKKYSNHKNSSSSRISRSSSRKLKPSLYIDNADSDTAHRNIDCHNQLTGSPVENDSSEQIIMLSETSISNMDDRSLAVGAAVVDVEVEHKDMELFSDSPGEPACIMLARDDSSTQDLDHSASKETSNEPSGEVSFPLIDVVLEPESPSSPKEAEQPSPVSVLEIPFPNDLPSGSECFDSINADLQGLRMQLQLLKLETEKYAEGMMANSSDEDETEESVHITEEAETLIAEENWESSFVADVLIHSGFGDEDPYTFMETWHSPECPIDDSIFQTLEKKYCKHSNWSRCEGKLLFDRVNSALVETCLQFTDPHPWVNSSARQIGPWVNSSARQIGWKKSKFSLEDCLYKLLEKQDTMVSMDDLTETVMKTGTRWLHLEDAINEICMEFEKLLIDELVRKVVITM